eukprot:CAMPEP_0174338080 /NCGR_PEP_ID=MMETSP0810-20121108/22871_1 /TAXON_ID=73025 ORGANISM="Eutreptiella gymnastica-like, Strain CCMP1594" /NCGR_SAMPLE_ID=MMETSP0810 /ASSEMBLY_ACC=CAM_ASM_000659 /LENGTH=113 /DNA_ID=CAMNT_0015457993 /DNA_START=657 /DNA_END=994 /DNA_ORIENTATION=-
MRICEPSASGELPVAPADQTPRPSVRPAAHGDLLRQPPRRPGRDLTHPTLWTWHWPDFTPQMSDARDTATHQNWPCRSTTWDVTGRPVMPGRPCLGAAAWPRSQGQIGKRSGA